MMIRSLRSTIIFIFDLILSSASALSQTVPSQPTQEDIMRDNLERRMNNMRNLDALARRRADLEKNTEPKARYYAPVLTKELSERLEIDDVVRAGLRMPASGEQAGLIKLIAQNDCTRIKKSSKLIDCYQQNANIREFANAFSFREKSRVVFGRSDIAVAKGHLVAGRRSVQTILVPLKGIPFDTVTPESHEISYLFSFRPAEEAAGLDAQFEELRAGITVANFSDGGLSAPITYSKSAKIEEGAVYALRAIAYRSPSIELSAKDADVVIVLKVVRADETGAVTILWKEISRRPGMVMKDEETLIEDGN